MGRLRGAGGAREDRRAAQGPARRRLPTVAQLRRVCARRRARRLWAKSSTKWHSRMPPAYRYNYIKKPKKPKKQKNKKNQKKKPKKIKKPKKKKTKKTKKQKKQTFLAQW